MVGCRLSVVGGQFRVFRDFRVSGGSQVQTTRALTTHIREIKILRNYIAHRKNVKQNTRSVAFVNLDMRLEHILDGLHVSFTRRRYLQLFTAFTRVLLAIGFIPPSIPKILHKPFTVLPDSHPVGHYFNALYQTGFYYEFIGWAQLTAALLLLIPRTSHIGALMFLPIIANVAILTTSVGFVGTWLITILMSLAAAWLVAWEYDRLKPILFYRRSERTSAIPFQFLSIPLFFAMGGIAMAFLWKMIGLGNFSSYFKVGLFLTGTGFVFGLLVALHYRFMRVGALEDPEMR